MKILVDHYLRVLASEESNRTNTTVSATLDDIIKNISSLAKRNTDETGTPLPDEKPWLPIEVKKMLLYVLFEGKAVIDTSIQEFVPEKYCTAVSVITVEGMVIAKATKRVCFDEVEPFGGYSANKRNVIMQDYAYGGAETKALTNAGIGMDFVGDIKDYSPTSTEVRNETLQTESAESITATSDIQATMAELDKVLSDKEIPETAENEEPLLVAFGKYAGEPLSDMKPNVLGWMLACIDTKQEVVSDEYASAVRSMVNANASTLKVYETYMKKHEENKKHDS